MVAMDIIEADNAVTISADSVKQIPLLIAVQKLDKPYHTFNGYAIQTCRP